MSGLYLTIDDGPSERFIDLVDFLDERNIQAVFFNRGDAMEARPEAVIYGIERGQIMANHAYSHQKASKIPLNEVQAEILRTEEILDKLYAQTNKKRPGKFFRFPYMDRGMGSALVEFQDLPNAYLSPINTLIQTGLGHTPPTSITVEQIERKNILQKFLRDKGFENLPVENVTVPWYANTEMATSIDSLCTFSTSDWAVSERHKGKHGLENLDDLKRQIDQDVWLQDKSSNHIILAHDQAEIHNTVCNLIDYFLERGFKFLDLYQDTLS